jgi:hypothetical protein
MIGCEAIVMAELVWSENINCVRISHSVHQQLLILRSSGEIDSVVGG